MPDAIGFNSIPGSGLTAPIMTFEFNSGGQFDGTTRLILKGHKTAAGSIALNTPTPVASQADVDALTGPGSMLREMFRVATRNAPVQPIWIEAVVATGTAPVWTITIGALPGTPGIAALEIQGCPLAVPVSAADTPTTLAAALAAAINTFYDPARGGAMLQVTATSAAAVVTVTARHAGLVMNEIDFFVPTAVPVNVLAATGVYTLAQPTAGVGTPDLSTALAALGDDPADFIVSPWSDATNIANYGAITNDTNGRWSWLRQVYGHVFAPYTGSFSATTNFGLSLNDRHLSIVRRLAGTPTSSWLWVAAVVARVAPWLSDCVTGNVSRNQTGLVVEDIRPPRDLTTLDNYSARNTLNNSGISTLSVTRDGKVQIDKLVTTYRLGPQGQPDSVFRDIQSVYQISGGFAYIRAGLATEHGQKAIADENPGGLAALTTLPDIKGTFIHLYDDLVFQGVFENTDEFSRRIKLRRNAANPARVDVYAAYDRLNPLDIVATNATIYAQYAASRR